MSDERRNTHRAQVPGVHATYETASGDLQRAEVMDLAVGGLFLRTDAPVAVGKRVALDIEVTGESAPWSALGRVVWIRPTTVDEERPAGMAIKLIDVDDDVRVGIERLVALRERTEPGVGGAASPQAQAGERTVLGVGEPTAGDMVPTPVAFAPMEMPAEIPADAPPAALASPITREVSIAIDLVARKSIPVEAALAADAEMENNENGGTRNAETHGADTGRSERTAETRDAEASLAEGESRAKKGSGAGWILLLAVLAAAMAAYVFREQLLSVWHGVSS
jgi:uncharacterized protein (TIGR02266 family)